MQDNHICQHANYMLLTCNVLDILYFDIIFLYTHIKRKNLFVRNYNSNLPPWHQLLKLLLKGKFFQILVQNVLKLIIPSRFTNNLQNN